MLGGQTNVEVLDNCQSKLLLSEEWKNRLSDILESIIEEETAKRVNKITKDFEIRLETENSRYLLLQTRYDALKEEMEISREKFNQKRKEWREFKRSFSTSKKSTTDEISDLPPVEVSQKMTSNSLETETTQLNSTTTTCSSPIIDSMPSQEGMILLEKVLDAQNPAPASLETMCMNDNARARRVEKKGKFLEALRTKDSRKHAHAKECSCCSPFYKIAQVSEASKHVKDVSKHRTKEEIQPTPPGFWDVEFTPRM